MVKDSFIGVSRYTGDTHIEGENTLTSGEVVDIMVKNGSEAIVVGGFGHSFTVSTLELEDLTA